MDNTEPNLDIGTNKFYSIPSVSSNDADICYNNCTLNKEECNRVLSLLANFLGNFFEIPLKCPLM